MLMGLSGQGAKYWRLRAQETGSTVDLGEETVWPRGGLECQRSDGPDGSYGSTRPLRHPLGVTRVWPSQRIQTL